MRVSQTLSLSPKNTKYKLFEFDGKYILYVKLLKYNLWIPSFLFMCVFVTTIKGYIMVKKIWRNSKWLTNQLILNILLVILQSLEVVENFAGAGLFLLGAFPHLGLKFLWGLTRYGIIFRTMKVINK